MNFLEYHERIVKALPKLNLSSTYLGINESFSYNTTGLKALRKAINDLEEIPYIQMEFLELKKSWLFESNVDSQKIDSTQSHLIDKNLIQLKIKLDTFREIAESSNLFDKSEIVMIKIPQIQSFDELSKYANELKKAIELPILNDRIGGHAKILSAEEGSIILYLSLGSVTAVKVIAGICWAAAVLRKKNAEASIFEQHARTLELKNEMIEGLVEAQKVQLKRVLESEANAILNKNFDATDSEISERLKLSITIVSDLIEKGVHILPTSKDQDIQKSFPDYNNTDLIESSIKQITSEN